MGHLPAQQKVATRHERQPKPLSQLLCKRLLAYAAAAGAGLAGSARTATAEVVYTPAHINLNVPYALDLNGDGIPDFSFHTSYLSGLGQLAVEPLDGGNKIVGIRRVCYFDSLAAAPLQAGAAIGPQAKLSPSANCMIGLADFSSNGPWRMVQNHYLGFQFEIEGKEHFGWARISGTKYFCCIALARITGYAYETVPDKPIVAGDTGVGSEFSINQRTLGSLAVGAAALALDNAKTVP
jgi:hypothetical protein